VGRGSLSESGSIVSLGSEECLQLRARKRHIRGRNRTWRGERFSLVRALRHCQLLGTNQTNKKPSNLERREILSRTRFDWSDWSDSCSAVGGYYACYSPIKQIEPSSGGDLSRARFDWSDWFDSCSAVGNYYALYSPKNKSNPAREMISPYKVRFRHFFAFLVLVVRSEQ